ncbi:MAG: TonB-dependent receptor, partial [Candidatus Acidiferrum sp.]
TQTGVKTTVTTDAKGFYSLPALPVGTYDLQVSQIGFKAYTETGLVINANSALRVDATLSVGTINEKIEVRTDAVHVETESTQMGEVITGKTMTAVPLNGRAYTDLLALQPGVSPYTATDTGTGGIGDRPVDGGLNSGNQSVNGQREAANGFMVNGSNVEEGKNNGTAIIPNLDSIADFRIITNNFDAEYGNYSGGQINVVTKSGTNSFHGSGFEFLRNTALDAKNYYSLPTDKTPVFRQNQFGGTFGGPIRKDKTFFFVDYQGTRRTQAPTVNTQMPSVANFGGNFQDSASSLTGVVNGPAFASLLSSRLGYTVTDQEPYYMPGCTNANCVFPGAVIPQNAWSPVAVNVLKLGLIPQPNAPNDFFESSQYAQTLNNNKGGVRVDQNTRFGNLFAYYFLDNYTLDDPAPNSGVGNAVPASTFAYSANTTGRSQLINLGDTKNIGSYAVNEFRFSYVRNVLNLATPQGGTGSNYTLANLGFVTPWNATTGGISPIQPSLEGVPTFVFNNFLVGVPEVTTRQYNNSFQWLDNFSKVIGRHSLKFGGQFHYDQINERNFAAENGQYQFTGNETGIDFADFLIGAPNSLTQASQQILDSRSKYYGLFAQDSWRATPNLVLNYGLRWEASMPWYDTQNKIETIIPGQQSVKFPGAPLGYVVAGDPGVPRTLAPTQWHNFSPRLGFAYSPDEKTSIRAGFGIYYTSVEDLSQFLEVGDPPYGLYYGSANPPLLEAPYLTRATGLSVG